jgi:beta-1,4-mannosyl-glycoprotein beta-1,4-N-acetylglucosaminyltransferase
MSSIFASRGLKSGLLVFVFFCLVITLFKLPFSVDPSARWTQAQPTESPSVTFVATESYIPYHRPTISASDEWKYFSPRPTGLATESPVELSSATSSSLTESPSSTSEFHQSTPLHPTQQLSELSDDEVQALCKNNDFDVHPERKSRKVYDLFLASSEVEWLEIRFNTLDPVVDYFVIVESARSFTYHPKPLYFKQNFHKFEKFAHNIIYRVLDFAGLENNSTWEREKFQRDALFDAVFPGLLGDQAANQDDVILVSDLDEIPKEETVTMLKNCKFPERVTIRSQFYYYSFQWQHHGGDWNHPQATFYQGNTTIRPEELRMGPGMRDLKNASWHCSSCLSTVAEMQQKIESFSHTEYNHARFKDPAQVVRRVRNGLDLFDRNGQDYDKVENNQDIPTYLKTHAARFPWILDRDPSNANFIDFEGEGANSLDDFAGDD